MALLALLDSAAPLIDYVPGGERVTVPVGEFETAPTWPTAGLATAEADRPPAGPDRPAGRDRADLEPAGVVAPAPHWDFPAVWAGPAGAAGEAGGLAFGPTVAGDGASAGFVPADAGALGPRAGLPTGLSAPPGYGPPPGGDSTPSSSSSPAYSPGSGTIPSEVGLLEMDFQNTSTRVVEDPGQTPYPAGPEVVDLNADGVIDEAAGDYAVPAAYVRGDVVTVAAKFQITKMQTTSFPVTWVPNISGRGYTFNIPLTKLTMQGNTLVLPPTAAEQPLPDRMHVSGGIEWTLHLLGDGPPPASPPSGGLRVNSGSVPQLYVTLGTPAGDGPTYHTVIHLSTTAAAWSSTAEEVLDKTWNAFKTRDVFTARAALGPEAKRVSKPLHYYKEWQPFPDFAWLTY